MQQGELTLNLMRTRMHDNEPGPDEQLVHVTNNPQETVNYFPNVSKLS